MTEPHYPSLDQLDTETRVLLALEKLDRKDPLFSTVKEIAAAAGLSRTTTMAHLRRLHYIGRMVEFSESARKRRTSWRLNEKGARRAQGIRKLKPRQRLIFATFRRLGEGHYKAVAEASGLDANGVSQSLGSLQDHELIKPLYNSGTYGWVYAAT